MGYELGKRYCALCRLRPREQGGNGFCAVPQPLRSERQGSPHLPHDCLDFKPGDLAIKGGFLEQDHLFDLPMAEPRVSAADRWEAGLL